MTPIRPFPRPPLLALTALAALLLALALAGCSNGPPELARVGSQAITVADFEDAARSCSTTSSSARC
jgi:starvation-inducible outer membrane lipoprotein